MSVETLNDALNAGWRVTAKCAFGKRDGMKSIRECVFSYELDLPTLIWTRGAKFPLSMLSDGRLRCPMCGSDRIRLLYLTPKAPVSVRLRQG